MINALWLLLIVPVSACVGYLTACFMYIASEEGDDNEKNS